MNRWNSKSDNNALLIFVPKQFVTPFFERKQYNFN